MPRPLLPSGRAREDTRGDAFQRSEDDVLSSIGGVALYFVKIKYKLPQDDGLVGTVVFLVVSDIIVRPISKLTAATKELSKGNYKVRVGYAGDDEIGKLYVAFNKMAVELNKQEARRQQFIFDVSHEFQTPLTAISGFAGILKMEDLEKHIGLLLKA